MRKGDDPKIAVLGLGHVGLPTALGFADLGWEVVGAEDDPAKADAIARDKAPFYEPGLQELLDRHLDSGRFTVRTDVRSAIRDANVVFVCVGTPQRDDGAADLYQLDSVARSIASSLNGPKLIVEKSTTPVQTAQRLRQSILRYATGPGTSGGNVEVAVNPEFLREGSAIDDFFNPDRIVLGVESERAGHLLRRLYEPLLDRSGAAAESSIVITDINTAEIIKHASNAFLSTKISFINMVSDLCDATGANVNDVALGMGMDPRIGHDFLNAGIGFGGYCFPKDLSAFRWIAEQHGVDFTFLTEVERINQGRADRFLAKVRQAVWVLKDRAFAVWGLSFKPQTDDVREAPSIPIVSKLIDEGAKLRLFDPQAVHAYKRIFPPVERKITYTGSALEACDGADGLLILTEWPEFAEVDLTEVSRRMAMPVIVDGRNLLDPDTVRNLGFDYYSIGRP